MVTHFYTDGCRQTISLLISVGRLLFLVSF
jgi:hypothetical protein